MSDIDPVSESKDWKAWEDRQPPGPASFHVSGTVVVRATNFKARLEKPVQGINPKILLLTLVVEQEGDVGGDAITPLPVKYTEKDFKPGAYTEVTVLRRGNGGAQIPEIDIVH